jgi:hypothetical protein
MSKNGVWQLRRLLVQVCPIGGSSRGLRYASSLVFASVSLVANAVGCRKWIQSDLPAFQLENPHLVVEVVEKQGHHPHLIGEHGMAYMCHVVVVVLMPHASTSCN